MKWGGGLPLAPSASVGDNFAYFEPVHGTAPDIAGKGLANPIGTILSGAMALHYLGQTSQSQIIVNAVRAVVDSGQTTADLGGELSTEQFTEAITAAVLKQISA